MITKDEYREVMIEVLTPIYQTIGIVGAILVAFLAYYVVIDPFLKRRRK